MLEKLFASIGDKNNGNNGNNGDAEQARAASAEIRGFAPYKNGGLNFIYNLLFCDNLELFKVTANTDPLGPWATLLAENPSAAALYTIAGDGSQESRLRALAYNRLREKDQPVPPKEFLGVIIEVGLEGGLDVLAAFPDGRVRYINETERMSFFEESPVPVRSKAEKLLSASQLAVQSIGPWDQARLAPPSNGMIRMSFLVSDGLYFGQGPFNVMQRDPLAGPIIAAGLELLQAVVDMTP
jgi:hypothetical protein